MLAEHLAREKTNENKYTDAFNFGPSLEANRTVKSLIEEITDHWAGSWQDLSDPNAPHEAGRLHLQIDKSHHQLGWSPRWNFKTTVKRTVNWYKSVADGGLPLTECLNDVTAFQSHSNQATLPC